MPPVWFPWIPICLQKIEFPLKIYIYIYIFKMLYEEHIMLACWSVCLFSPGWNVSKIENIHGARWMNPAHVGYPLASPLTGPWGLQLCFLFLNQISQQRLTFGPHIHIPLWMNCYHFEGPFILSAIYFKTSIPKKQHSHQPHFVFGSFEQHNMTS